MAITTFAQLMEEAREVGPKTVAIAAAQEKEILLAAQDAEMQDLCECILVGDRAAITEIAQENSIDIRRMMIIHEPEPKQAARKVMELVRMGHAQMAMKGKIETGDFLRAALDREVGLRIGRLLTHVGILQPKVAVLAATEMVNPKIPTTLDAANLSKMADRGQIKGGLIDGPLALDNAISLESARIKGIKSDVAGRADILIPPDVEAANVLAKAITYFAKGHMAGVVVGGKSPIVVASRSDPHQTKLVSMALGVLLAT